MAGYFLDTSALAKLYHEESGSEYVERIASQPRGKAAETPRVPRGLRTLDAMQFAIAIDMLEASWISVILSADKRLCEVAEACGCPAIDPAQPGLVKG